MRPPVPPPPFVPPASRRRRRGFTLVELLVVIGIIGLLIAILLPAIRRVRYQAKLTDCAVHLHQIGIAVLAYANDHKGWYPRRQCNTLVGYDEPYWLRSEPGAGQKDDREMFRPYVQTVNYLRCPLNPEEIDLEDDHGGRAIIGGYELWFGTQMVRGDPNTRMFKVTERPKWNGRRFRVLAADIERVAYWLNKVNTGHPDFYKLSALNSTPPDYSLDPTAAISMWHHPGGVDRGPIDRNFLFDDGSVVRYTRLVIDDPAMSSVPYIAYMPESTAAGRLPGDRY